MAEDRSYIGENTRERERMRAIVDRLSGDDLRISVNPHWTIAAVLGHIAFWDARVLSLADKLERGEPSPHLTPSPRTSTGSTTPVVS
jgi:hypothetical protein